MFKGIATVALLIISNAFMTLAWYGHIAFKSKLERFGMLAIVLLSWGIALFEYCFQVPANRIGSSQFGRPFSIWELKVIQEVVSLSVFTLFALVFMKSDSLRWNHLAGFLCLILRSTSSSGNSRARSRACGKTRQAIPADKIHTYPPGPEFPGYACSSRRSWR